MHADEPVNLITEGLKVQAATVSADEERERLAERDRTLGNYGARIADDCFCSSCGKRGVVGLCRTCEGSGR